MSPLRMCLVFAIACSSNNAAPPDAAPFVQVCETTSSGGCSCEASNQVNELACKEQPAKSITCCAQQGWPAQGHQCTCEQHGGCGFADATLCTCYLGSRTDGNDTSCPAPTAGRHCCKSTGDDILGDTCDCSPDACPTNDPMRTWTEVPACNLETLSPCSQPDGFGNVETEVDACSDPSE